MKENYIQKSAGSHFHKFLEICINIVWDQNERQILCYKLWFIINFILMSVYFHSLFIYKYE